MDSIRLKNYRCFSDTGEIELKPLTFLVGANSTGKSSLIKQFPLLKQSMRVKRNGVFLWNDLNGIDFNNFNTTLKDGESEMTVEYRIDNFAFSNPSSALRGKEYQIPSLKIILTIKSATANKDYLSNLKLEFFDHKVEVNILESGTISDIIINGQKMNDSSERVFAASTSSLLPYFIYLSDRRYDDERPAACTKYISELRKKQKSKNQLSNTIYRYFTLQNLKSIESISKDIVRLIGDEPDGIEEVNMYVWFILSDLIDRINQYFIRLASNISYVQPIRARAERFYRLQNTMSSEIASDGTNLAMYLFNLDDEILKDFQDWTEKLFNFKIELSPSEGHVQMQIVSTENVTRNLIDVGFGYSQILPILAIIWRAITLSQAEISDSYLRNRYHHHNDRVYIAIEQPELHLHPRFIRMFADMLAKVIEDSIASGYKLFFIIETHSETLLDRIGEIIAEEDLDNENVSVLLFNASKELPCSEQNIPYIEKASYTEDGYLVNWPFGFLS